MGEELPEIILNRYHPQKQQHSLSTWALLVKLLRQKNIPPEILKTTQWTDLGKPYWPESSLHFSLTHTPTTMGVSLGNANHGFDLEDIRPLDIPSFSRLFKSDELTEILKSQNPESTFFTAWTLKEAWSKKDGGGLFQNFKKTDFQRNQLLLNNTSIPCFTFRPFSNTILSWVGDEPLTELNYLCQDYGKYTTARH